MRGLTGELEVVADGKQYRVAFEQGAIVAAYSPLVSDAAVRVALTSNLITSTQIADITRRMAAQPDADEVDLLAELARLSSEQAQRLRRRLVAQRAARTFALERGDFVVDTDYTLLFLPGSELDVRAICFLGAKTMTEEKLANDLMSLGGWFKLKEAAFEDLPQYGFIEADKPALQMLVQGCDLADIEDAFPEMGARAIRSVTYALLSCGALEMQRASRPVSTVQKSVAAPPTGNARPVGAAPAQRAPASTPAAAPGARPAGPPGQPAPQMRAPAAAPAQAARPAAAPAQASPPPSRNAPATLSPPPGAPIQGGVRTATPPQPRRAKRNSAAALEIEQMLVEKIPLLDKGADHFTILGLPIGAPAADVRKTYFDLARKLHPDRLSAIGVVDDQRNAQRLMAQINQAFAVLNDPAKREEYMSVVSRGGEAAVREQDAEADETAMKILRAEEAFKQGEMALRRDQVALAVQSFKTAVELAPREPDFVASYAWAQFLAAPDKNAAASSTRRALQAAAMANDKNVTARFYQGRLERILGKEREALALFQQVLTINPRHTEAAAEVRILEQRLKGKK
jgi:DnaJ-domain-containing protein 1